MQRIFKKANALVIALAITTTLFTAIPVQASAYKHQDEDAIETKAAWANKAANDSEHGRVYFFTQGATYEGTDWFSSEFEDGTYVVSMDFKVPAYPASGTNEQILVDSETYQDRTLLDLRAGGVLGYTIRDAGGARQSYDYKYGTNYDENKWNNYSVVYEKSGTDVDVTLYVNGIKVKSTATRIYDNFRFKRVTIVTSASNSGLYLDNITCRKIESSETLSIEKVSPILSGDNVSKLFIKFNEPVVPSTVSSVTVNKDGSNTNVVSSYRVVGQYIEATTSGLAVGDKYSLSFGSTPQSIVGKTYSETVAYKHQDEDAIETKAAWANKATNDSEHGRVYYFTQGATYEGTDWFSSEFGDGTYVVSMDFKVPAYPASGTFEQILVDSETYQDRTRLDLRAGGVLGYTIRDAAAVRQNYDYKYGTNYNANEWNNYSIVYEKSGTDVDVTQYVNGVKVKDTATRIYDNFRFKRVTIETSASNSGLYLDNITCRKIESSETLSIEKVSPILSGDNVSKLFIKFNEPVAPSTVSSVVVNKDGSNTNVVSSYRVVGQYIEATVSGLTTHDQYTLSLGGIPQSIVGKNYDGTTYNYLNDVACDVALYDSGTKISTFDSSCADKTLRVCASLFNLGNRTTSTMLLSSLYSNAQETATAYANMTNGDSISTSEGVIIAHNVIVPAEADSNYTISTFVWDDMEHIRPLLIPKKTH